MSWLPRVLVRLEPAMGVNHRRKATPFCRSKEPERFLFVGGRGCRPVPGSRPGDPADRPSHQDPPR